MRERFRLGWISGAKRRWHEGIGGYTRRRLVERVALPTVALVMVSMSVFLALGHQAAGTVHAQSSQSSQSSCTYNPLIRPTLLVDKSESTLFQPGQTITIYGSGYRCNAQLTVLVTPAGQTSTPSPIQLTTDATGTFNTTYTIPLGSNASPYPIDVKVYDAYAVLQTDLTLHSCQDKGSNLFTSIPGCGPETLLQDSSNYAELQPLEQQAEQEIATLRNVANDTTNVYFSRGEIRAQMLVDLLTMLNNCQGGTDNGTCSSIDENIIGSYSMAVRQQRVDIAKLADELYEGSGMFCIPGTTSCGWQSWESNQCSFLVPLGQGAQSGPNAQDTDQLAYQHRKDTQSACGGLGNTVAPQPSYDDFTSWAAAAVLGAQLQKWAASLQKYNSVISGTNPWDEAQQEYIAAGDGFQEGVDFLTVQGAEAPTATASPAAVTDQQSINDLLSSLKVEFGPDVLIDFTKSVVQNIVEELAPTLFSGDIELLGAAETFVPLIIGAALLAAPALAQLTTNSELACQLQNAVTAAQNDNLYDDVHGTASYTYTSINGESCPSGTVTLAPSTGVEMLLNALMVSTMPDFTVLRNKLTPPQFGPVQPSDPVFVRTFQSENFSTNTSVTESTTQSQIDVESWSGTTNDVSIVNGWFNVHGSYQPDLEYQHDTEMYRAWINGSQFVTYRVAIPLGGVIVQGTIEGICPGVPEFGATVDPGLCVIPPGPVSGTLPYETASFHPHTPISPGDQIAIGQMTGDQGSTPAIEHANIRTVQAYASIDPPTFLEEGITIATPLLPDNPSSSSQYYPAAYQLSQPAPTCFTKAGVTGSIECGNDPVLYYQDPDSDVTGSTSSVWLHSVGAADDSFTADSSGQASGTVLGNDAPTAQDQTELLGVDTTNGYAQFSVVAGVSNGQLNLNASTPVAFATTGGFEYTANSGAAANSGGPTCQQFPISGVPSSVYAGYKVCGGPTASAGDSFIYKLCYTVPKFGSLDNPAPTVCTYAQVTIMGIPQTLLFSSPGPKSYGDPAFANPATSNGPGTISYATGSGSVGCTVDSATGLVTITGAAVGSNYCILVATQAGAGGGGYLPAPSVTIQFHIAPALLFVTASHADLSFGGAAPDASSYTYSFSGFAPSDTRASVVGSTAPDCTTNYQQGNGVGTYAISCAIGTLSSPNYTFVSGYNGSDGFSGTNGTALASTPVQLGAFMVNQADTATALSSSPSAPVVGQTVTLTATVSPSPDGGTVTFTENGVALPCGPGSQSLSNGTATCVTTESIAGSHIIKASYSGDTNFHGSSASLTQPVTRASTTTSLTVSSPTQPGGLPVGTAVAVAGKTVTFTATIAVQTPGSGTPTGTVSFYQDDSTTPITCGPGSQAFSNGTATCTVPESGVGHHSITATYNGDSNYSGSSAGLTLYVDTDLSSYLKNGVYNLSNVKLSGGYFVGANLKGANLSNGNFSGANFSDANLSGANLNDGNFSNANFTGAELSGANLGNSNLKGAMLNNVVWSNTTCPDNTNSTKDGGSCMGHL